MKVLDLLDQLEDLVDNASSVPLTGKAMVSREEVLSILKDIRIVIPDEVKQARWIKDERTKILNDAQQEAERIMRTAGVDADKLIHETHERVEKLVQKDEIVKQARNKGQEIIDNASIQAEQIRHGAYNYADDIMKKLQINIDRIGESIQKNRVELESYQNKPGEQNLD